MDDPQHIAAQRVDYQPPYAGKRDGARLPFRLIVRRHVDGLISVVRHLADFAEKETELASSHALRWVGVKHQEAGVHWIRITRIRGFPVPESICRVAGIQIAPHDHAAARRIWRGDLAGRQIGAGTLRSEDLSAG